MVRPLLLFTFYFLLFTFASLSAQSLPKSLEGKFVNDFAGLLDDGAEQRIEQTVRRIRKDTTASPPPT
jgi:uncharacterized membrane protein YgcG